MMIKERFKAIPAVYLFFEKNGQILLASRKNTGYYDGTYMVPGGHVEPNEPPTAACVREAMEELGVRVDRRDVRLVHVTYRAAHGGAGEYMDMYFVVNYWSGEPVINEPEKSDELKWFDLENLPENMPEYLRNAIIDYKNNVFYTEVGWDKNNDSQ